MQNSTITSLLPKRKQQEPSPLLPIADIIHQSTVASAERAFDLLGESKGVPEKLDAKIFKFPQSNMKFDQVRFSLYKRQISFRKR